MTTIFLHGLDSSGNGTKGRYFAEYFPEMVRPDFEGSLSERMTQLNKITRELVDLVIVGSSFGGLMGACLALDRPETVRHLIMLAPALNFEDFQIPVEKVNTKSLLVIGTDDIVTPPDTVIPAARATFSNLQVDLVEDDHLLHNCFYDMDWSALLAERH